MNTPRAERLSFSVKKASFPHENTSSATSWKQTNTLNMSNPNTSSHTSLVDLVKPKPKRAAANVVTKNRPPAFSENTISRHFQPAITNPQLDEPLPRHHVPTFEDNSTPLFLSADSNPDEPFVPMTLHHHHPQAHFLDQFSSLYDLPAPAPELDENENLFRPLRRRYSDSERDALVFAVLEHCDPFSLSNVVYMEEVEPTFTTQMTAFPIILDGQVPEPFDVGMDMDYVSLASNKKRILSDMDDADDASGSPKKIRSASFSTLDVFPTFITNTTPSPHLLHSYPLAPTFLELHDVPELNIPLPPPSPTIYSPLPLRHTRHNRELSQHLLDDMNSLYSGVEEEFGVLSRNVRQKLSRKEVEVLVWNLASDLVVDRAVGFDSVGMAISVA